jgi:exodeoxyribonuclease V gamma subunit
LPVKDWGDIEFTKFLDDFIPFAKGISERIIQPQESLIENYSFDNGVLVQASFNNLYLVQNGIQQMLFKYSNAKNSVKYLIRASLYDLAAKAMKVVPENSKFSLIAKDGEKSFGSSGSETAKEKLSRLAELYLEGLRKPLPFFPNTSAAYTKNGYNAAVKKWESSKNFNDGKIIPGEGDDAYVNCCFGSNFNESDEFKKFAREIVELLDLNGGGK